jgi:hypothetical protein
MISHLNGALGVFASAFLLAACSHSSAATSATPDATASDAMTKPSTVSVLTQHNDNARTGANTAETCLTPSNVSSLAQVGSFHVDGLVYAQALVIAGDPSLLIVASASNVLAAFNLKTMSTTPVWQLGVETFGIPGNVQIGPGPLGIISTPVVDPATNRIYVIARSCESATAVTGCPQTVHVIDATSGKHLDSVVATGSFTDGDGGVHPFNPDCQMNRPALLLQGGKLIAGWGAMTPQPSMPAEKDVSYHGTVMAFDTENLHSPPLYYVTTPRGFGGGLWESGGGLAGDGTSIYFASGNSTLGPGTTPTTPLMYPATPLDQENSVVRLKWTNGRPVVASYFDDRPYHSDGNVFQYSNFGDYDLGSSGVALIPGSNVAVSGSKAGIVYPVDQTTMQQTQTPISAFHAKTLPAGQTLYIATDDDGPEMLGSPVVWRRMSTNDALVYFWPRSEYLTSLRYLPSTGLMSVATVSPARAGRGGGAISLTSNGDTAGILWASASPAQQGSGSSFTILAYDAEALTMLWQASVPGYPKFVGPTIANGRVFVPSWATAGGSDILVYGEPACGN